MSEPKVNSHSSLWTFSYNHHEKLSYSFCIFVITPNSHFCNDNSTPTHLLAPTVEKVSPSHQAFSWFLKPVLTQFLQNSKGLTVCVPLWQLSHTALSCSLTTLRELCFHFFHSFIAHSSVLGIAKDSKKIIVKKNTYHTPGLCLHLWDWTSPPPSPTKKPAFCCCIFDFTIPGQPSASLPLSLSLNQKFSLFHI